MRPKGSTKLMRSYTQYMFAKHLYKVGEDVHVLCDDGDGPKISIGKIVEFRIPSSSIEKAAAEAAAAASKASQGTSAQASSKSSTSFAANAAAAAAAAVTTSPADVRGVDPESVEVHLIWWYRPEEARGGRKQFHGEREVFKSAHSDAVPASSLDGHARVYTLAAYQNLDRVRPGDYYWRFHYLPDSMEFKPEKVPIFCRCNLPYNPDTFMLMCSRCEDWFHPRCVGLSRDGVAAAIASRDSACPQCVATAAAASAS